MPNFVFTYVKPKISYEYFVVWFDLVWFNFMAHQIL